MFRNGFGGYWGLGLMFVKIQMVLMAYLALLDNIMVGLSDQSTKFAS